MAVEVKIVVYTKPGCPACEKTKTWLVGHDLAFEELLVGRDVTRDQVLEKFPDQKTVPVIVVGPHRLGGFDDLVRLYEEKVLELMS